MAQVDPLGIWPDPQNQGQWATQAGLKLERVHIEPNVLTQWVNRVDLSGCYLIVHHTIPYVSSRQALLGQHRGEQEGGDERAALPSGNGASPSPSVSFLLLFFPLRSNVQRKLLIG
jgi:hypothetical protein